MAYWSNDRADRAVDLKEEQSNALRVCVCV